MGEIRVLYGASDIVVNPVMKVIRMVKIDDNDKRSCYDGRNAPA